MPAPEWSAVANRCVLQTPWVEEVPGINCQEATYDALIETIKITLREAIELNKTDARAAAISDYSELALSV